MSNSTNSASATKVVKPINGMPEQKLKQARLPFKSTTVKKNTTTETGKKRKHEDDTENQSQPSYIDLTDEKERSQAASNTDTGVKSSKVCIIQAESKPVDPVEASDQPKATDSKPTDKCPLQKWLKPKKVEVTSDNTNVENKSDEKSADQEATSKVKVDEQTESMQVDESIQSQEADKQNGTEDNDISLVDDAVNDSVNLSTDVDMSENDRSFNKTDTSAPSTPSSKSNLFKKLTPKQKSKREENELKRLERERQKKEKEKKRLEEKEERQRQKEEKEKKRLAEIEAKNEEKRQKEEERKAKEEEKKRQKEEERRLKEEERKQKEEERKQKEEERKQKEEERKQKEEEKRQKEEQKRLKEEQERKLKQKTAAAFTNFFLPKNKETPKETAAENNDKTHRPRFMPFEVKENMRLACVKRVEISRESLQLLDEILQKNEELPKDRLYLAVLKSKTYKPGKSENTWPLDATEDDDDVMIVDEEHSLSATEKPMRYRCKLIQFHENKRPAYWGTWRKNSKKVSGRAPFKQEEIFDYEVDSDEEWEDEPGEDLEAGSEDEKESEDDYEVDNDVFVPHGYLSDEEGQNDDVLDSSPTSNKLKLNVLERQFEEEMKEKTHKLKPRIFGCIWIENIVKTNEGATNVENLLLSFRAVFNESKTPFCVLSESKEATPQNTPSLKIKLKNEFPDSLLPDLVRMAHGSKKNTKLLAKEFNVFVLNQDETLNLTLSCITNKLKEISVWNSHLACRLVNDEIRNKCGLNDLSHTENNFKYITAGDKASEKIPKSDLADKSHQMPGNSSAIPSSPSMGRENAKIKSSITKFVKVLTAEEKQQAFNEIISEKNEKQSIPAQSQKPKPKNDITKFIKFGSSVGKSAESDKTKTKPPPATTVAAIDLTEEDSNPAKESSDEPASKDSKCAAENTPDLSSKPVVDGTTLKSPSASKNTPNKSVNILIPRKIPRSPTVNVLVPRKVPSRPLTSANSEMPPPSSPSTTFNFDEIKPEIKTFTPKRLLESLNKFEPPKPVNVLVPRRAKDLNNSENSKPVNVLVPRRATDAKPTTNNEGAKIASSSKPVNILIPRRAKDVKKDDINVPKDDSKPKPPEVEKVKDFVQDDASSDFSLCIEASNDAPEPKTPNESHMEVDN